MKNSFRIAITSILAASILVVALLIIMPWVNKSNQYLQKISEYENEKNALEKEIIELYEFKSDYYILNSVYDKYNTQVPLSENLPVLTDQIYEVAKYSGIKIDSIIYEEVLNFTLAENKVGAIDVDMMISGSYYQVLTFINTLEIMPRFLKLETISLSSQLVSESSSYESNAVVLSGEIIFKTFYDKTDYDK